MKDLNHPSKDGSLKGSPLKQKIIVVCGQTATGKSDLAVEIAKKYNGAVLSVDSRQIYRGGDLASGKVPLTNRGLYEGIEHFGVSIASMKRTYTVAQFQRYAKKIIEKILASGRTPILCGGSGLWIDALVYGTEFPKVKPNKALRVKLAKLSTSELFDKLTKLDPVRAKTVDRSNPFRLIRAIEIATAIGKVPRVKTRKPMYDVKWIVLSLSKTDLEQKVSKRLTARIKKGMVAEIRKLHDQGVSHKRLMALGLEFKFTSLFLQKKLSRTEFETHLKKAILQYAKRQDTWFKKFAK
ncbi:MAG TPA: tRNA (adenosine(37)-N6)-dimethylallyltransferase MiaA [Patescibacteria group bacterium]|nr:tRNA (adenosine(37)-N6)-dimethylallyltransferase MiaA [Patescibacteria group bacterium]